MLGFSRTEERFLLLLVGSFLIGSGIRFYQRRFAPLPKTARYVPLRSAVDSTRAIVPQAQEERKEARFTEGFVSINQAGIEELSELPGIGPVLARRIVDFRNRNGVFLRIDDLLKVQGIGSKKLEVLRDHITL
jgi:comEA protein